jgi:ankyrin repeat protein
VKRIVAVVLAWSAASAVVAADSTLIDAVKGKQHEAAVALIEKGADVRAREVDGTTALHYAAHYEDADLVKRLLKAGADVKAVNDYGATALSEAAVTGNPEIIKSLLAAGADAKATNKEGQTTLMVVARTGHVEAAKLLLKARVDVNATEQWGGQTALMWAAAQSQPQMVKLLIQHKADVNARAVVRDWQRRITAEGRPKDMNHGGLTPLLYAAREGCVECARELIKGGADIDLADPDGTTPLVLALTNMRFDLAAYLIKAGADINKWDFYGQTPLYVAVDLNTLPRGGRPDLPSTDNLSGYDVAAQLLAAGANPNPQLKLRPPYRNAVFDRGGDQVLSTGATPLLLAAKVGDAASVALLLKHKARIDIANVDGVTPLMAAAGMGHSFNPTRGRFKTDAQAAECLKLLMAAGGDVNTVNEQKLTAMHSAASLGWNDTIKLLVDGGALLEAQDARGMTPIDYAVGRHPRAFLEPEHTRKEATITLLRNYIVAATGRQPKEFDGTMNVQTRGTGGASN